MENVNSRPSTRSHGALIRAVVRDAGGGAKGMGEPTGVARQAVKPPIETMSGTIKDIKTGPCERTTGALSKACT